MRKALLDAAVESLIQLGFARTTTLEVQRRAGVSRGALLHHFPSKALLLVATIDHLAVLRGLDLRDRAASLPTGPRRVDAVIDLLWECFAGPLFQVALELSAAARTEPDLRAVLTDVERDIHDRIVRQAADLFGAPIAARPGFRVAMDLTLHFMMGAATTALVHGDAAPVQVMVTRWKSFFPTLLQQEQS